MIVIMYKSVMVVHCHPFQLNPIDSILLLKISYASIIAWIFYLPTPEIRAKAQKIDQDGIFLLSRDKQS